jgi:hypothetical protein
MIIRSKQNGAPGMTQDVTPVVTAPFFIQGALPIHGMVFLPLFTDIIRMIWLIQLQTRLHWAPLPKTREKHGSAIQLFDLKVESKLPSGRK